MKLANPCFYKPHNIDFLIGGGPLFDLKCISQIQLSPSLPVLQKTSLGWIITGRYCQSKDEDGSNVDSIVRKFWELEEFPTESTQICSEDHEKCENEFKTSVRRLASGKFEVSLPFRSDPILLGSSFDTAKRRFLSLERRLSKDGSMRQMYHDFMKEYFNLGHMSLLEKFPDTPHKREKLIHSDSDSAKALGIH